MFRRVLTAAAGIAILISALLVNLALLDVITVQDLRTTLGKIVSVIVVSTIAVVLVIAVMKIGERR